MAAKLTFPNNRNCLNFAKEIIIAALFSISFISSPFFFSFHFSLCFCTGGVENLGDHAEYRPDCGPAAKKMAVMVTPCCRKISLILSDTGRACLFPPSEFAKERASRLFLPFYLLRRLCLRVRYSQFILFLAPQLVFSLFEVM